MKVYNSIGSKERFLEIFQGVNKIQLNEVATNVLQTGTQLVEKAFEELKNKQSNVKQTNTQKVNDDNFVEIITNDNEGNEITFRFKVTSTESDQEGVFNVDEATLVNFKIQSQTLNVDMPENMKAVQEFNEKHVGEIMDVISEYTDFETNTMSVDDELYEEAIKLIDRVPYKKGTEQMQTNKAYADQKPTNPALRVKSNELNGFVGENVNSVLHYSQAARDSGMLYPEAKSMGVTNQYILKDTLSDIGVNIVNIVDVGDKYQITFEFNGKEQGAKLKKNYGSAAKVRDQIKKKLGLSETEEYVDDEYTQGSEEEDILALPPEFSAADMPKLSTDDDGTKGIDPLDLEIIDDETVEGVSPEKVVIINQAYDNLIASGNKAPTIQQIMAEINKLEGIQPPKKTRGIPKNKGAEAFWESENNIVNNVNEEQDYPDQIGKKFKPKNQIPKKKKKLQADVKLSEESEIPREYWGNPEDEMNEEISNEPSTELDIEQLSKEKEETGDMLAGGLADDKVVREFDPEQLAMGLKVEMEHTDNPMIALEIAMDHLSETSDYYTHLDKMENDFGDEQPESDDLMSDELLGYKPHNVNDYVAAEINEEDGMEEYGGEIGDRYQDANNNQFTVRDKVKGGVTLQGQGGEKEVGTSDLQFMKKLNEEELIEMARRTLNKRELNEGMSKKEAVQILIKHNIK